MFWSKIFQLGKFKAEVEMLRLKLAEQEAKHEALKQFVAKNLKIDVDPELLGEIKKKKWEKNITDCT